MIDFTIKGGKAMVMCYGQTGSGKTYTLLGSDEPKAKGIVQLAIEHLHKKLKSMEKDFNIKIEVEMCDIRFSKLKDLLL